jgi:hypothetical protein
VGDKQPSEGRHSPIQCVLFCRVMPTMNIPMNMSGRRGSWKCDRREKLAAKRGISPWNRPSWTHKGPQPVLWFTASTVSALHVQHDLVTDDTAGLYVSPTNPGQQLTSVGRASGAKRKKRKNSRSCPECCRLRRRGSWIQWQCSKSCMVPLRKFEG